jgi:hypothetical protein
MSAIVSIKMIHTGQLSPKDFILTRTNLYNKSYLPFDQLISFFYRILSNIKQLMSYFLNVIHLINVT